MSKPEHHLLFEQLFGMQIAETDPLYVAVSQAQVETFGLGESLSCPAHQMMLLMQGRIRIVNANGNGLGVTLLTLNPGAVLDCQFINLARYRIMASSDSVMIMNLPQDLVQGSATLKTKWEETVSQIEQAKVKLKQSQAQKADEKPAEPIAELAPVAQTHSITGWEQTEVNDIVQVIFNHFGLEIPVPRHAQQITTADDFAKLMAPCGFATQVKKMSWTKLLNADYPLVLVDEKNHFRWIVGRKGNSLEEEYRNQFRMMPPPATVQTATFTVVTLQLLPSKAFKKSTQEPFSLGWYMSVLAQDPYLTLQMIMMSILCQIFGLGMPVFYLIIFDRVFRHQNLSALDLMSIGLIIVLAFDMLIKEIRSYVQSHLQEKIDQISSDILIDRLFSLSMTRTNLGRIKFSPEMLAELFRINQTYISTIVITSLDTLFSVIIIAVLLMLHLKLALIALSPLILIAAFSFGMTPFQKKEVMQTAQEQRKCQLKLAEILEHNETIKSLNVEHYFKHTVQREVDNHIQHKFPGRMLRASSGYFIGLFAQLGTLAALYEGAHIVLSGELSYGIYMAVTQLGRNIIGTVQKLVGSIVEFFDIQGSVANIRQIMLEEDEYHRLGKGVIMQAPRGQVRVVDVRFRYQPDMPWVLKDINLEMMPGEKVILTGRSGSGKTSLIRLLQRLYNPNSGYITLDNIPMTEIDLASLRRTVGVAVQKPALFSGSIRENILLGDTMATMAQVVDAATLVGLDTMMVHLPNGLDTEILPKGSNLSGGQIAQVALARIMLMNPDVLIMDEADSPIDNYLKGDIYRRIMDKYRSRTCIMVTDYLPTHQKADRIIVLHQGQIVEHGHYQELIRKQGYYFNLYHSYLAEPIR